MEALAEQDVDTVSSSMLEHKAIALHIGGDGLRRSVDSSSDKLIKAMQTIVEAKKNMPTTDWDYACDVASQLELRRA